MALGAGEPAGNRSEYIRLESSDIRPAPVKGRVSNTVGVLASSVFGLNGSRCFPFPLAVIPAITSHHIPQAKESYHDQLA